MDKKNKKELSRIKLNEMIAEFIKNNGVKECPVSYGDFQGQKCRTYNAQSGVGA